MKTTAKLNNNNSKSTPKMISINPQILQQRPELKQKMEHVKEREIEKNDNRRRFL
jgi:hypothetical protein